MENQNQTKINQPIAELIAELGSSDLLQRQHARLCLAFREGESVPALLEALHSPNAFTRGEAVRVLGDIRVPGTVSALIDMLMDENTGVRWAAMESVIRMGHEALRPLLERFIKDFDSLWLREGVHHILRVFKDQHGLNERERILFEELDKQTIPGFESGWTSEQAWAAEKALEVLDREIP
jgi:HEAT repeat protein